MVDLNALHVRPPQEFVKVERRPLTQLELQAPSSLETNSNVVHQIRDGNHVVEVYKTTNFADHPLVVGPRYIPNDIKYMFGSQLGYNSSGIFGKTNC